MANAQATIILRHLRKLAAPHAYDQVSDRELLRRFVRARDEAAFTALVRRHGPMVLGVCQRVLHHRQDAEDACQATFLVLARKATSSRWHDSVANWLYEVARQLALKARTASRRRATHESRAQARPAADPLADITLRELQAVLDEELARLPAKYRAPLILCCLEGTARDEAAQQLGWTLQSVKNRLERGRELLRARLTRRGLTLSADLAGTILTQSTAPAVLPPALVSATSKAGVLLAAGTTAAGAVSAEVAALVQAMSKAMLLGRVRMTAVFILALGVLAAGAGALTQREVAAQPAAVGHIEASKPMVKAKEPTAIEEHAHRPAPEPALEEQGDKITIRGRVVDPDGKPLTGAEISIGWFYGFAIAWFPPIVEPFRPKSGATSGPDGRFCLTFTKAECYAALKNGFEKPWCYTQIVASAEGYGPAWAWLQSVKGEMMLGLARDDVPIHGRILDLQGRAAVGATVRLDRLTAGNDYLSLNSWRSLPDRVPIDREGRFVLRGVGRDRVAFLHIEGPTIEHKIVQVSTSGTVDGKPVDRAWVEVVAGPTKPIVGTIRAKDTGKPLAGVLVYGNPVTYRGGVRAVTNAQGRYRLVGLPKASSYDLEVRAPAGLGYLSRVWRVPDNEGLKPLYADYELRRAVTIHFRLVNKQTGQPVRGAVLYSPLQDNPLYPETEEARGLFPNRLLREFHFPDKGHLFNLVAYPGPGVIFAWVKSGGTRYLPARLDPADRKKGYYPYGGKDPLTMGFLELCEGYRIIDPDKTDESLTFDMNVDSGRTVQGCLVGPDSKPVTGASAFGLSYSPLNTRNVAYRAAEENQVLKTGAFTAVGLDPESPRTITFFHKERKLIGHVVVERDENGPLTVRLQPWGTLTGRLVDAGGKPLPKVRVKAWHNMPAPGIWPPDASGGEVETDRDGRFRLEYLDPSLKRELLLSGELSGGENLKNLTVRTGQTKDLGDIPVKLTPGKKPK